jgi:hypothetical protein
MKQIVLAVWLGIAAISGASTSSLPFIVDNYAKAVAEAQARHVPLFVEVAAPW